MKVYLVLKDVVKEGRYSNVSSEVVSELLHQAMDVYVTDYYKIGNREIIVAPQDRLLVIENPFAKSRDEAIAEVQGYMNWFGKCIKYYFVAEDIP